MRRSLVPIVLLLAGCGQAGDLYMPGDPAAQPQPPAASAPVPVAPGEQDPEKKKD